MPHKFIKEKVDIFQIPELDQLHNGNAGAQITIGDLHGNAMKLMFMLVYHGIATNLNKADYDRLVAIYKTTTQHLTKENLDEFNQILSKIQFTNNSLLRLIGDELADRGNNDYFTLKILEKLDEHKVPLEILISNHSLEFIYACEKQKDFKSPILSFGNHAPSMENLEALVDKKIVAREEILSIANKSYKSNLRAISYSLSEEKEEITIYSHAGIGLSNIKSLAQKLTVEYKDSTVSELAQTIDSINVQYQKHVQSNTVHTLYCSDVIWNYYRNLSHFEINAPLEFIMWNRTYFNLLRPAVYSNYNVNFVHGHDSRDQTEDNIYNLDNNLGKAERLNIGDYTVLYSQKEQRAPEIKPIEIEVIGDEQPDNNPTSRVPAVITLPDAHESLSSQLEEMGNIEIEEMGVEHPGNNLPEPAVITLSDAHQYLLSELKNIETKERYLRDKGHVVAADKAKDLYNALVDAHEKLTTDNIDVDTFKHRCTHAINNARPVLEKHRGWKQVLGNLALAVIGLGGLYVIAGFINKAVTGNFLFFKTDSSNKIDQLEHSMKSITGPR